MNSFPPQFVPFGSLGSVCRLGLATRGGTRLTEVGVQRALDLGINFLNWPGHPDALSRTIAGMGSRREQVHVCVQFQATTARAAERELGRILKELHTDYIDILTFYYVEREKEWEQITASGGALEYCLRAREQGKVRLLGVTSHQRPLAARMASSGHLDALMIRYNAAHRGAETEIFPTTDALQIPVIAYTCLRWGTLLRPTPNDPPGWEIPRAPAWYRFVLQHPAVTVALAAPNTDEELDEDFSIVNSWQPLSEAEHKALAAHGQRVRQHAPHFP